MSEQTKYPKLNLLGLEIDRLTIEEAVDYIANTAKSAKSAYVVKPYVEVIDRAVNDPSIMALLNRAELCLADGVSLQWAAHYLNKPHRHFFSWLASLLAILWGSPKLADRVPELFAGITFTDRLLSSAASRGLRVFLVGSPRGQNIEATAAFLGHKYPGLKLVGVQGGRDPKSHAFSPSLEADLLKKLRETKPDLVLVGLGFPKQEEVMARLCQKLDHGVLIGEGGTFDYRAFGGRVQRAPKFWRRLGLEWMWRLIRHPSRWRRQMAIPRFMWRVYRARNNAPIAKKT